VAVLHHAVDPDRALAGIGLEGGHHRACLGDRVGARREHRAGQAARSRVLERAAVMSSCQPERAADPKPTGATEVLYGAVWLA
jgi:hypothetical protein